MSFLVVFCPVKIFGYLLQDETLNKIVSAIGPVVALTGVSVSGYLSIKGPIEWVPTATVIGVVGTAVTVLALENKRILTAKTIPKGEDVVKAVDYLATNYWKYWENEICNKRSVSSIVNDRPNIPNEFARAFGKAFLEALGEKINSRYEKICEEHGANHPSKWEFRPELPKLREHENQMYDDATVITKEFRKGLRAFNRGIIENSTKPLLYCDLIYLLKKYHHLYKKTLAESIEEKRILMSQQKLDRPYNLPLNPENLRNLNLVNEASVTQNLQPSSSASGAADGMQSLTVSGSGSSNENVAPALTPSTASIGIKVLAPSESDPLAENVVAESAISTAAGGAQNVSAGTLAEIGESLPSTSQSRYLLSDEPLAFLTILRPEPRLSPRRNIPARGNRRDE